MKNIHVLPSPNPSRLYLDRGKLWIDNLVYGSNNQHIYITSNSEIKGGYIFYSINKVVGKVLELGRRTWNGKDIPVVYCKETGSVDIEDCKKIILTTDPELIKNGVQAIDDTFLEWFVKNHSSCEEVEVKKECCGQCDERLCEVYDLGIKELDYKIIIPRKNFYCGDEVDYDDKCLEQCKNCNDATGVDYGYLPKQDFPMQKLIDIMEADEELRPKTEYCEKCDLDEWVNLFKNNSKEEIFELLKHYKFPL